MANTTTHGGDTEDTTTPRRRHRGHDDPRRRHRDTTTHGGDTGDTTTHGGDTGDTTTHGGDTGDTTTHGGDTGDTTTHGGDTGDTTTHMAATTGDTTATIHGDDTTATITRRQSQRRQSQRRHQRRQSQRDNHNGDNHNGDNHNGDNHNGDNHNGDNHNNHWAYTPHKGSTPPFPIRPDIGKDPLVLDLAGRGINLTPVDGSKAFFDYSGSGFAQQTGWIAPGEGILVFQPDGTSLTSIAAKNILGAVSGDGFADLSKLDANTDGEITSADPEFKNLRVWVDANQNGSLDPGELYSLSDLGITSIDAEGVSTNRIVAGNAINQTGSFQIAGQQDPHAIAEVNFAANAAVTEQELPANFQFDPNALKLPELDGYGLLPDLQVAMTSDPNLAAKVAALADNAPSMSGADFDKGFQSLVQYWAGASNVDPNSRGSYVNAQHLAVVYAFYGIDQNKETDYQINPNWHSGENWEIVYQQIIDELKVRFLSQISSDTNGSTSSSNPLSAFSMVNFDPSTDKISVDFQAMIKNIVTSAPNDKSAQATYYQAAFGALNGFRVDLFNNSSQALIAATLQELTLLGAPGFVQQQALISLGTNLTLDERDKSGSINVSANSAVLIGANDTQISGGSNDVYVAGSDFGNVTVADGGNNRLLVLQNISKKDIEFQRDVNSNDLKIYNKSNKKSITLNGYFGDGNSFGVSFNDGLMQVSDVADAMQASANLLISGTLLSDPSLSSIAASLAKLGFQTASAGNSASAIIKADANSFVVAGQGSDQITLGDLSSNETRGTIIYNAGDGNLEIDAHVSSWNTVANTLQLTDLKAADVLISRSGSDLLLTIKATGRTILVPGEFNSANHDGIQSIVFADGTTLSHDQIQAQAAYRAGTGDVTVTSQDGAATLVAGPGNDKLVAGDQSNTGNTTFVYGSGDGNLEIDAHVYSWNTVANTLQLTDLKPSDVVFTRSGNDLLMTVTATGRTILVPGEFNSANHDGIQSIVFADGTTLSHDQIQAQAAYRAGTGDVTVTSQDGAATLVAGPGNDVLVAGDQDNTGNTTFVYGSGDGNLEIDAHVYSWNTVANTLQLTDLKPSDVVFTRSGNDLLMTVTATGRTILVPGEFNSANHDGIQSIVFADGTTLSHDQIQAQAAYPAGIRNVTVTSKTAPPPWWPGRATTCSWPATRTTPATPRSCTAPGTATWRSTPTSTAGTRWPTPCS